MQALYRSASRLDSGLIQHQRRAEGWRAKYWRAGVNVNSFCLVLDQRRRTHYCGARAGMKPAPYDVQVSQNVDSLPTYFCRSLAPSEVLQQCREMMAKTAPQRTIRPQQMPEYDRLISSIEATRLVANFLSDMAVEGSFDTASVRSSPTHQCWVDEFGRGSMIWHLSSTGVL